MTATTCRKHEWQYLFDAPPPGFFKPILDPESTLPRDVVQARAELWLDWRDQPDWVVVCTTCDALGVERRRGNRERVNLDPADDTLYRERARAWNQRLAAVRAAQETT